MDQDAAVRNDGIGEGKFREIAERPGEQQPVEKAADRNAARAFIDVGVVGLALRIVKLLLLGLDIDLCVRLLAEVDFGALDLEAGRAWIRINRHVRESKARHSFRRELI